MFAFKEKDIHSSVRKRLEGKKVLEKKV